MRAVVRWHTVAARLQLLTPTRLVSKITSMTAALASAATWCAWAGNTTLRRAKIPALARMAGIILRRTTGTERTVQEANDGTAGRLHAERREATRQAGAPGGLWSRAGTIVEFTTITQHHTQHPQGHGLYSSKCTSAWGQAPASRRPRRSLVRRGRSVRLQALQPVRRGLCTCTHDTYLAPCCDRAPAGLTSCMQQSTGRSNHSMRHEAETHAATKNDQLPLQRPHRRRAPQTVESC